MNENEYELSISEASRLIGVCENTLRDWDVEGKLVATRTEGNHRRYSIGKLREYLELNPPKVEIKEAYKASNVYKEYNYIEKYKEFMNGIEEKDKKTFSIILENVSLYHASILENHINYYSIEEMIELASESWKKIRFKKMVSIQPLIGPTGLVHYLKNGILETKPIAAKSRKLNTILYNKHFNKFKDVYSDAIALELEETIIDLLPKSSYDSIKECIDNNPEILQNYDYIIGSSDIIDQIELLNYDIDLYRVNMIDCENFKPVIVTGNYNNNIIEKPIFSPYILITNSPIHSNKTHGLITRYGVLQ